MNIKKTYKTLDVCRILKINRSNIQYYVDTGLVKPFREAEGRGSYRLFSPKNIVEILLIKVLVEGGVGLKNLTSILDEAWLEIDRINKAASTHGEIDYLEPATPHPAFRPLVMAVVFKSEAKQREVERVHVFQADYKQPLKAELWQEHTFLWVNLSGIRGTVETALYQQAFEKLKEGKN